MSRSRGLPARAARPPAAGEGSPRPVRVPTAPPSFRSRAAGRLGHTAPRATGCGTLGSVPSAEAPGAGRGSVQATGTSRLQEECLKLALAASLRGELKNERTRFFFTALALKTGENSAPAPRGCSGFHTCHRDPEGGPGHCPGDEAGGRVQARPAAPLRWPRRPGVHCVTQTAVPPTVMVTNSRGTRRPVRLQVTSDSH